MRLDGVMMLVYAGVGSYTMYRCAKKIADFRRRGYKQYIELDKTPSDGMTLHDIIFHRMRNALHKAATKALKELATPTRVIVVDLRQGGQS